MIGLLLSVVLVATGCAPKQRVQPPSPGPAAALGDDGDRSRLAGLAAERARDTGPGGYRIGPDDLLEIRIPDLLDVAPSPLATRPGEAATPPVSGAPTFAQGVRVSASGDVTLPLLGQVRADGLTPSELERDIARRLVARGILRSPQVSVSVVEYRSRVVAVVGAVEHPGLFPLTRPHATVSDLIWAAGGPSKDAGRVVNLVPADGRASPDGGAGAPIRLDLDTLLYPPRDGRGAGAVVVRPGDVISLAPAGNVSVQGWVEKPGSFPVTRGLSVAGAVAAAGGPLFAADRHRATVQRNGGSPTTIDLDAIAKGEAADPPVTDGDVVRVPASTSKVVPWGAWKAASEVFRVGGSILLF